MPWNRNKICRKTDIFFAIFLHIILPFTTDEELEKYLPWSNELPDEIKNYEEEYKELNFEE